ncbi:MAG: alpha/beta fold hydrolase [Ideonella sp.]
MPQALDPRPAVLLLHGLCANPLELMPLGRQLRHAGYHVSTPQLPGYGVSPDGQRAAHVPPFEDWVGLACQHFDQLAARHDRVVVGGLCMGAVLALALACKRPVAALVLVSTTLHFDGWNVSPWRRLLPLAYLPGLRNRLSFRETEPYGLKNERLRAWVAQAMASKNVSAAGAASLPAASLHQATRLMKHVRRRLPQLTAPAVVLHATEDDVSGPRTVHQLAAQLGSKPEVHWFHDSYHMLTLDNERVAVAAAASDFLIRVVPLLQAAEQSATIHQPQGTLHERYA